MSVRAVGGHLSETSSPRGDSAPQNPVAKASHERGAWNSRIGFILAAVGGAVGLGNLVLFPYRTATNGGATFVLIYIAMMFLVGIPAILAELAIGRRYRLDPVGAFREAGRDAGFPRGVPWIGVLAILSSLVLLSYYTVITGWALDFFVGSITGSYFDDAAGHYGDIEQGPYTLLLHLLMMGATVFIVARGVAKGIEKSALIMLPILFVAILGIMVFGFFQSGAGAGLRFYLTPDFGEVTARSIVDAAGQTFFSIGIGFGLMIVYASYMSHKADIVKDGVTISFSDFAVALVGGLMVFPLVFSYGLGDEVTASSVGMIFEVVPQAFAAMGWVGYPVATVFFLAIIFAALSSAIALLEVIVATLRDQFGISRGRAAVLAGLIGYTLGIGSAFSGDFLGRMDVLMANVLIILSGLALSVFAGWWIPGLRDDINEGARFSVGTYTIWMLRVVVPLVLVVASVLAAQDTCEALFYDADGAWSGCSVLGT